MRSRQPEFVVHRSPKPNGKQYWYIIGRPHGERVRAWFDSEAEAKEEAERRNQEMQKGSPPVEVVVQTIDDLSDSDYFKDISGVYLDLTGDPALTPGGYPTAGGEHHPAAGKH